MRYPGRAEGRTASPPRFAEGVAASLVAEAAFVSMVAVISLLRGMSAWMVVRVPASLVLGPEAVQPPGFVPGDVLLGLLMHLWLGVLIGLVYAALLPRLGLSPVVGGLIAATVLYLLGFWILPQLFPDWLAPFWLPPAGRALQAGAHAFYGAVFGIAFQRLAGS